MATITSYGAVTDVQSDDVLIVVEPDAPVIGSGYAVNGQDIWEPTSV
jgi:hypothetical protein